MNGAERLILGIDTCGAVGTIALAAVQFDTDTVTCLAQAELGDRAAAAELMPAVAALLQQAGQSLRELAGLVVVHGPGSFTGVRVGLSTAKGMAHASGLPVFALSRLAVLADLAGDAAAMAVLDAGRGEFYVRQQDREWLASAAEVTAAAQGGVPLVVAEPLLAERLGERLPAPVLLRPGPLDALAAIRAARSRLRAGDADDLATLDANYLRRSDAELFARPAPR